MLILLLVFGGIVYHYSQFGSGRQFVLASEEAGAISLSQCQGEYQNLSVRNRYPFVLVAATYLCRVEGDATSPRFLVLDSRSNAFEGKRSLYSGAFESHLTFAVSEEGFFVVTDQPGEPQELLEKSIAAIDSSNDILPHVDPLSLRAALPPNIASLLTQAMQKKSLSGVSQIAVNSPAHHGKMLNWFCTLPGDHSDMVLVISITPVANYEQ